MDRRWGRVHNLGRVKSAHATGRFGLTGESSTKVRVVDVFGADDLDDDGSAADGVGEVDLSHATDAKAGIQPVATNAWGVGRQQRLQP